MTFLLGAFCLALSFGLRMSLILMFLTIGALIPWESSTTVSCVAVDCGEFFSIFEICETEVPLSIDVRSPFNSVMWLSLSLKVWFGTFPPFYLRSWAVKFYIEDQALKKEPKTSANAGKQPEFLTLEGRAPKWTKFGESLAILEARVEEERSQLETAKALGMNRKVAEDHPDPIHLLKGKVSGREKYMLKLLEFFERPEPRQRK